MSHLITERKQFITIAQTIHYNRKKQVNISKSLIQRKHQVLMEALAVIMKVTHESLPETSETVSFSHETTVMYASTEEGIMHLKTATLPLMAFWSSTRTVYGSRKTKHRKIVQVTQR